MHDCERGPGHLALLKDLPSGRLTPLWQCLIKHIVPTAFTSSPLLLLVAEWVHSPESAIGFALYNKGQKKG